MTDAYDLPGRFRQDTSADELSHRWLYFGKATNQWPRACARSPRRLGMISLPGQPAASRTEAGRQRRQPPKEPSPGTVNGVGQRTPQPRPPYMGGHIWVVCPRALCDRGSCRWIAPSSGHGSACRRADRAKRGGAWPEHVSRPAGQQWWTGAGGPPRLVTAQPARNLHLLLRVHKGGPLPCLPFQRTTPLGRPAGRHQPALAVGWWTAPQPRSRTPPPAPSSRRRGRPGPGVATPETGAESPLAPAKGANLMRAVQIFFEPALPPGGALAGAAGPPPLPPAFLPDTEGGGECTPPSATMCTSQSAARGRPPPVTPAGGGPLSQLASDLRPWRGCGVLPA